MTSEQALNNLAKLVDTATGNWTSLCELRESVMVLATVCGITPPPSFLVKDHRHKYHENTPETNG